MISPTDANFESFAGAARVKTVQVGFPVELTGVWDASTGYPWKRLMLEDVGVVDASPVQMTGTNAVPIDGNTGLTSGTKGWLEPDPGTAGYLFLTGSTSGGGISGSGTDNRVVRWNGTSAVQDSGATLTDGNRLTINQRANATGTASPGFEVTTGGSAVIGTGLNGNGFVLRAVEGFAGSGGCQAVYLETYTESRLGTLTFGVQYSYTDAALCWVGSGSTGVFDSLYGFGVGGTAGLTGTLGPGAAATGGVITNIGSGSFVGTASANTFTNTNTFPNTGLVLKDTDDSHGLTIAPGSNLTAGRTLTLTTGDASRTLDISAGNVTITAAGNALTSAADASAQRTVLGLGTGDSPTFAGATLSSPLTAASGGTGVSSTPTNGQVLIGNGSGYTLAALTAGSGISITNGAGSITIAATGGGGGVTSVAATAPAAGFTISGSPITSTGTFVFALSDDLAALEGMSGTGLVARTASNTYAQRTLTGPASGITVSNGNGVSGNPTLALANDLAALEALTGTDTIYYRSGTDTWSPVTIGSNLTFFAGTLNALASTGGVTDGDYGDITVSGLGTVWTIDADVVTYAKMQNVSATQRLIGRNSAGSGDPEEVTLSQALDWASGTAADGNILVRASGAWTQQPGGAYSVLKDVDAWNERWFCNTNASGSDPFIGAAISSGTNTTAPSGTALNGTRYGGVLLRQSATANSGYLYQTTATSVRFGTESRLFRAHIFHATALTNRTVRVGFHDSTTSADAVDGVYFEIVAGVATGKTSTNSTRSSTGTTHTATVNVWYVYEIEVNAAGTLATFRVLDTSETQLFSATLTTNIPTASGRESAAGIVATANTGAAADICVLGYMAFGTRAGYNRMRTAYAAPASTVLRGYIDGLVTAYNSTTNVDVGPGQCADDTNSLLLSLTPTTTTKILQNSGSWTAGTGNNGLDTGARAINTWYHVYVIANATGTTVDVLFSLSATAPTMPSGYTLKRRIGSVQTDSFGSIKQWVQRGEYFLWNAPQDDISALNPGTSAVTRTLSTPTGVRTLALVSVGFDAAATGDNPAAIYLSDLSQADTAASVTASTYVNFSATAHIANTIGRAEIWTNTSSQIRSRIQTSTANTRLRIQTHGWRDLRGKDN